MVLVNQGKGGDFKLDENGHRSSLSIHPGATKMYQDLKRLFWWPGMKKEIIELVYACLICQESKIKHQKLLGLMQPLFVLEWKWDNIAMDFVGALPKTVKGFDSIWVIFDRLTKSAHFVRIKTGMSVAMLAEIYIEQIVRLHGIPSSIASDRDPRFTSIFWESLQAALGTKLRLSSAYDP